MTIGKRKKDWCRDSLPLGTVRIRRKRGGATVRVIKVRMDGPRGRRWVRYARFWWEQNRGPVPAGLRVIHADGDSLNDDPSNYVLGTPADTVYLWHEREPELSEANYAKCRSSCAAFNREKALCRRVMSWLKSKWYPVDHAARVVLNTPCRMRWQVYGDGWKLGKAGRGAHGVLLGWPGVPLGEACILAAMSAAGKGLTAAELLELALPLRAGLGWPGTRLTRGFLYGMASRLPAGWIVRRERRVAGLSLYRIGPAALAARGPVCPVVPVRGSDLAGERFAGYRKLTPELEARADEA